MNIEHHKFNQDRQTNMLIQILELKVEELEGTLRQVLSHLKDDNRDNSIIIKGIEKALK